VVGLCTLQSSHKNALLMPVMLELNDNQSEM
jgi:hypothetical protein